MWSQVCCVSGKLVAIQWSHIKPYSNRGIGLPRVWGRAPSGAASHGPQGCGEGDAKCTRFDHEDLDTKTVGGQEGFVHTFIILLWVLDLLVCSKGKGKEERGGGSKSLHHLFSKPQHCRRMPETLTWRKNQQLWFELISSFSEKKQM